MVPKIIQIVEGAPVVSHRVIASNIQYDPTSIRKLIDEHKTDFEEFGAVSFEMTPRRDGNKGGDQQKTYYLNEQQATLLMTYLKNSDIVRQFKKTLVRAFFELRDFKQEIVQKDLYTNAEIAEIMGRAENTIRHLKNYHRDKIQQFTHFIYDDGTVKWTLEGVRFLTRKKPEIAILFGIESIDPREQYIRALEGERDALKLCVRLLQEKVEVAA